MAAGIQAENIISAAEMVVEAKGFSNGAQEDEIQRALLDVKESLAIGEPDKILSQSRRLRELLAATLGEGAGRAAQPA